MSKLLNELNAGLPEGITLPPELPLLYDWIETHGLVNIRPSGGYYGRINRSAAFSPDVTFDAEPQENVTIGWVTRPELVTEMQARLRFFADSGMDGSRLGLWRDNDGKTVFVHLGSGSGSSLACVIADNGTDFMRLLGIGYLELGHVYDFAEVPHHFYEENRVNPLFRQWIETTFHTTIPETAQDIILHPGDFLSDDPQEDSFCHWIIALLDKEYPRPGTK